MSAVIAGRPGRPRRTFQVQKMRNALRCQAMTVWGFTIFNTDRHSAHTCDSPNPTRADQRSSMAGVSLPSVAELQSDGAAQHFPAAERPGFSLRRRRRPASSRSIPTSNGTVYGISATSIISSSSTFTRTTIALASLLVRLRNGECTLKGRGDSCEPQDLKIGPGEMGGVSSGSRPTHPSPAQIEGPA